MFNLAPQQIALLLTAGLVVHLVWLALSMRFHPLFVLAVAFSIVAPFAVAKEAAAVIVELKYGRVYLSYLMALVTVWMCFSAGRFGKLVVLHCGFFTWLLIGALTSKYPVEAFLFKSIGFATFLGGAGLALATRDLPQFRQGVRLLFASAVFAALFFFYQIANARGSIARLDAFGLNPNFIGWVSASGFGIAFYLAIFERAKTLRMFCLGTAIGLVIIVLFTGSRAAFAAIVIQATCILVPLVKRPGLLVSVATVVTLIMVYLLSHLQIESASRVLDTENTRKHVWRYHLEEWQRNPLFGQGTVIDIEIKVNRPQWINTHSMYIQVLCETGAVGAAAFAVVLAAVVFQCLRVFHGVALPEKWLAFATLATALEIGLFELAPLTGTFSLTLFWGMGIGLLDRLPAWDAEARAASEALPLWGQAVAGDYDMQEDPAALGA